MKEPDSLGLSGLNTLKGKKKAHSTGMNFDIQSSDIQLISLCRNAS